MYLPIYIGFRDHVQIDQRDTANSRARQSLGDPGSDSADADNTNVGVLKTMQRSGAIKSADSAETALKVGCPIDGHLSFLHGGH